MARVTKKEILEDRQDVAQPMLLDAAGDPAHLAVLDHVRQRSYEHKGLRLTEDEARSQRLVELLLARWGAKKIAREMHISVHTVRAARRLLTQQGKLAPILQRVVETMEDILEVGTGNYLDALEEGRVAAAQIPVGVGIIFDKMQLALGRATSITGHVGPDDPLNSPERMNAYLDSLMSANPPPTDSQSLGKVLEVQQIRDRQPQDDTLDASCRRPSPDIWPLVGPATWATRWLHPTRPAEWCARWLPPSAAGGRGGVGGADVPQLDAIGSQN